MDGSNTRGSEQRQFTRHEVRGEAKLEPLHEAAQMEAPAEVWLQDIGRTGVMFHATDPLEVGSTWRLRLIERGDQLASMPVIVRHCRRVDGGGHAIGAQFMVEPVVLRQLGATDQELLFREFGLAGEIEQHFEAATD